MMILWDDREVRDLILRGADEITLPYPVLFAMSPVRDEPMAQRNVTIYRCKSLDECCWHKLPCKDGDCDARTDWDAPTLLKYLDALRNPLVPHIEIAEGRR